MNGVDFVAFVAFGTVEPLLKGERIFQQDVDKKVVMFTFMVVIFLYLQSGYFHVHGYDVIVLTINSLIQIYAYS